MALSTPGRTAAQAVEGLSQPPARRTTERAFRWGLAACTLVGILVLVVLLVDILRDGIGRLSLDFLTTYASRRPEATGILASLTGTLSLMALTALFAFPIGVGAAVYLEEFAPENRFTRLMQVNIANLAGVPSVVYGLLAASVFVNVLGFGRSLLTGGLALALLVLPIVIVAGREAVRGVPQEIREGGLALGATRWQVTRSQVLPAALPGILTGTILALSRAIGETAPLLVVGAAVSRRASNEPWNVFEAFSALPTQIFDFVTRPQEGFQIEAASAAIIVLLATLLVMNAAAILLRNRYSRRW